MFFGLTMEERLWTMAFLLVALAACGLVALYQNRKNKKDTIRTRQSDRRSL